MANNPTPEELDLQQAEQEERQVHRAIGEMKDESEREIMRDVFENEQEPEDDGDRSLEEPEDDIAGGEPEAEQQASEDAQQEREPEAEPEQEEPEPQGERRDEQGNRFIPYHVVRQERDARQRAERELADMRARQQQYQPPPPPPQPQQPPPDLFVDPDAHFAWREQQMLLKQVALHKDMSLQAAREQYGDDYNYVYNTLSAAVQRNDPAAIQIGQAIVSSANPGWALMQWGQSLLQERGEVADRELRETVRERYGIDLEEYEQRNSGQRAPRQQIPPRRGMPSLNSAAGNGRVMQRPRDDAGGLENSDEALFNDVFSPIRR
jgi:hypothetical protein